MSKKNGEPTKTEMQRLLKPYQDAIAALEQADANLNVAKEEVAKAVYDRVGSEQFKLGGVKYAAVRRRDKDDEGNVLKESFFMKVYGQKEKKIRDFG